MDEERFAFVEVDRAADPSGRSLSGVVLDWGRFSAVQGGAWEEAVDRGAFGDLSGADLGLVVQHDRGAPIARTKAGSLRLVDEDRRLRLVAELPETPRASQALADVNAGLLTGFSVRMNVVRDHWSGMRRRISRARLVHVGLVDSPAYDGALVDRMRARHDAGGPVGIGWLWHG